MIRRLLVPWRALIAVAAIAASASSARAEIYLRVTDTSSTNSVIFDVGTGASGTFSIAGGSMPVGNPGLANVTITGNWSNVTAALSQSLTMTATVNATAVTAGNSVGLSLTLFSSTSAVPAPPGSGIGVYSLPSLTGGSASLLSRMSGVSLDAGTGSFSLQTSANYYGYGSGTLFANTASASVDETNFAGAAGTTTRTAGIATLAPKFDIASIDSNVSVLGGQKVTFTSTAVVMPEPSGVAAVFAGLPCVGMLIGYARRLRGRPTPETAA
jgi:hypothetical protein